MRILQEKNVFNDDCNLIEPFSLSVTVIIELVLNAIVFATFGFYQQNDQ